MPSKAIEKEKKIEVEKRKKSLQRNTQYYGSVNMKYQPLDTRNGI